MDAGTMIAPAIWENLAVAGIVIVLVVLSVWLLIAFKKSTDTLDCMAGAITATAVPLIRRYQAALRSGFSHASASRSTSMPAPSRDAFSLRWRRKARAPGWPLNSPSICLVML